VQAGTVLADAALMTMPAINHDPIDFTFADDGDLVRRTPKAVPEDPPSGSGRRRRSSPPPGEKSSGRDEPSRVWDEMQRRHAIEVKHGSGKVKV
jgi:hypothetical protein